MIAEDDPHISEVYTEFLEENGHDVECAKDGLECLNIYRKELSSLKTDDNIKTPFDIVIVDFSMPVVNGGDVIKTIYNLCPSQHVIFATAHSAQLIEEIFDSGSVLTLKNKHPIEILQKPFSYSDLLNLIEIDIPEK